MSNNSLIFNGSSSNVVLLAGGSASGVSIGSTSLARITLEQFVNNPKQVKFMIDLTRCTLTTTAAGTAGFQLALNNLPSWASTASTGLPGPLGQYIVQSTAGTTLMIGTGATVSFSGIATLGSSVTAVPLANYIIEGFYSTI